MLRHVPNVRQLAAHNPPDKVMQRHARTGTDRQFLAANKSQPCNESMDFSLGSCARMKGVVHTGILEQRSSLFAYLHPFFVGLSVAPLMKKGAAGLEHVVTLPQHCLPVGHQIQDSCENHCIEVVSGKWKLSTFADDSLDLALRRFAS